MRILNKNACSSKEVNLLLNESVHRNGMTNSVSMTHRVPFNQCDFDSSKI